MKSLFVTPIFVANLLDEAIETESFNEALAAVAMDEYNAFLSAKGTFQLCKIESRLLAGWWWPSRFLCKVLRAPHWAYAWRTQRD